MLTVNEMNFFTTTSGLKHVSIWDNVFKHNAEGAIFRFLDADPRYIVYVDPNPFSEGQTDANIYFSLRINATDVDKLIGEKSDEIHKLIDERIIRTGFVLDLLSMKEVRIADFTLYYPKRGLNTYFIVQGKNMDLFYALYNPVPNHPDIDIFNSFISFLYQSTVCLFPTSVPSMFAKKFTQVVSALFYHKGQLKYVTVPNDADTRNAPIASLSNGVFVRPKGKTERVYHLLDGAMEECKKDKEKEQRKFALARSRNI